MESVTSSPSAAEVDLDDPVGVLVAVRGLSAPRADRRRRTSAFARSAALATWATSRRFSLPPRLCRIFSMVTFTAASTSSSVENVGSWFCRYHCRHPFRHRELRMQGARHEWLHEQSGAEGSDRT